MKIFCCSVKLPYNKLVRLLALLISFCLLLGACQQPMEPVDSWKAKILVAHGGVEALERIDTLVFIGTIVTKGDSGTVTLTWSRSEKFRATMKYTQKYEDRILLGHRGWRDFGAGFEEVVGPSLDAMIFQYNHLNLPMGFLDEKVEMLYVDQKTENQAMPILELTAKEEPPMAVIIDPETGLIRQVNGKIHVGGNEVIMGVGYRDYKIVDGVLLPHLIINYVNGQAIAESKYDTVLVNPELDPKSFYIGHNEETK